MKKGTTGTHYKPTGRRDQSFTLRLTSEELTMIRTKAELSGMPVSEFIINACTGKKVSGYKKPTTIPDDNIPGQIEFNQ